MRKCAPTAYAVAQGVKTGDTDEADGKAATWWLLRTVGFPTEYSDCVAGVMFSGRVNAYGFAVSHSAVAVRPALWIEVGS